jgi:hypothetical protein
MDHHRMSLLPRHDRCLIKEGVDSFQGLASAQFIDGCRFEARVVAAPLLSYYCLVEICMDFLFLSISSSMRDIIVKL